MVGGVNGWGDEGSKKALSKYATRKRLHGKSKSQEEYNQSETRTGCHVSCHELSDAANLFCKVQKVRS